MRAEHYYATRRLARRRIHRPAGMHGLGFGFHLPKISLPSLVGFHIPSPGLLRNIARQVKRIPFTSMVGIHLPGQVSEAVRSLTAAAVAPVVAAQPGMRAEDIAALMQQQQAQFMQMMQDQQAAQAAQAAQMTPPPPAYLPPPPPAYFPPPPVYFPPAPDLSTLPMPQPGLPYISEDQAPMPSPAQLAPEPPPDISPVPLVPDMGAGQPEEMSGSVLTPEVPADQSDGLQGMGETAPPGTSWSDVLKNVLTAGVGAFQQKKLMEMNIARAQQGLPPISATEAGVGAQVSVGLDPATRNLIIGGVAVAGLVTAFVMMRHRKRGA